MATLAQSPVMGGEWAGGRVWLLTRALSLSHCGGWAIPCLWFCRCSRLSPSHSSLVHVCWPLMWVAILALRSCLAQVSTHEGWRGLGAFEEGGCSGVHAHGGRCGCLLSSWVVSVPRWVPAGWGCLPWALLSVFIIVGVFVLVGDSGGWWPAVRVCDGSIYTHIP